MFDTAATEFHPLLSLPEDFAPGEWSRLNAEYNAKRAAKQAAETAAYKLKQAQEAFKPTQPATRPASIVGNAEEHYYKVVSNEELTDEQYAEWDEWLALNQANELEVEARRLLGMYDNVPDQTYESLGLSTDDFEAVFSIKRANVAAANPMRGYNPVNGVAGVPQLRRLLPDHQIGTAWDTAEGLATIGDAMQSMQGIAITGAMGTGKTKAVLTLIAAKSVLYIVPSRALGEQLVKRIPNALYATDIAGISPQGPVGKDGVLYRSVVCCTPSLHRVGDAKFDVVVVDEAMSTLRQLHLSELCAARRPQLLGALHNVLSKAANIVVMDANLTPNATRLLGFNFGVTTCHTTFEPMPCTVNMMQGSRMGAMAALVESAQRTSDKILVHVDSMLTAEQLDKLCQRNGVGSIIVSAETKADREQNYFLTDTALFWTIRPAVQVVIATNVLSCGFSVEGEGATPIGQVWGIFQGANGQTPDDYAQALFRVRSTVPRFVWAAKGASGFATLYKHDADQSPALKSFVNRMRKEQSKLRDFLATYLVTQGCTLEMAAMEAATLDLTDSGITVQKQARVDRLKEAATISQWEYENLRKSRYLHSTQKRAMARYEWVQRFGGDLTEAQWELAASGAFSEKTALAQYLLDLDLAQAAACPDADFHRPHLSSAASWVVNGLTSDPLMMAYMGPFLGLLKGEHQDATGEGDVWAAFNRGFLEISVYFRITARSSQDLLGRLLGMVGIKRDRKKRSDQSWAYSLNMEHWAVWKSFVQVGSAVVDGVKETVKKIQATCAATRSALGMVAHTVAPQLVAMVLPEVEELVVEEQVAQTQADFEATFDPAVFFADRPQIHRTKDGRWWQFQWASGGFWTPKWLGRSAFYPLEGDQLAKVMKKAKQNPQAFEKVCCIPIPQILQIPYVVNRERWYENPV